MLQHSGYFHALLSVQHLQHGFICSSTSLHDLPDDWNHAVAEVEAGIDLVPLEPLSPLAPLPPLEPLPPLIPSNLPNRPSLSSFFQSWFQGLFRPLANMTAVNSSSGSRFPTISGPVSHRPFTSIQAIIQGIFNRRRNGFGDQSMIHG